MMKRIVFFMTFLISMFTFSETLESISYRNGVFNAVFKERKTVQPAVKLVRVGNEIEMELQLNNVRVDKKVPSTLITNDEFVKVINVREYNTYSSIKIHLAQSVETKTVTQPREIIIEFNKSSNVPTNTVSVNKLPAQDTLATSTTNTVKVNQTNTTTKPAALNTTPLVETRYKDGIKEIVIPKLGVSSIKEYSPQPIAPKNPNGKYTIVVDAGHGGHDPGAIGNGYREKDIALAVSKKLAQELRKDYNVIMTRDADYFVELSERANIGNRANADFFVSIHLNGGRASATGTEVFYYERKGSDYTRSLETFENSLGGQYVSLPSIDMIQRENLYYDNQAKSSAVGRDILDNLVATFGLRRRGNLGANFAVLRNSNSPAVLVELGFMSNYGDVSKFVTEYGQEMAAKSIANGIRRHFRKE